MNQTTTGLKASVMASPNTMQNNMMNQTMVDLDTSQHTSMPPRQLLANKTGFSKFNLGMNSSVADSSMIKLSSTTRHAKTQRMVESIANIK